LQTWCSLSKKTLQLYPEKPFLGMLGSYQYKTKRLGLFAIVNPLKSGAYRADFYKVDKTNGPETHLGYATFTDQGGGLFKVLWSSGEENIASANGDGLDFECPSTLDSFLSRADCMLNNLDQFNQNIDFITSLNGNRLFNSDVSTSGVGLLMVFNKKSANQYVATEYTQAQNGTVGEVTSATMVDLGFGRAIGTWDDGTDALFGYSNLNPPKKLSGSVSADGEIYVDCADDPAAKPQGYYINQDSCYFYSVPHKTN